MVNQYVNSFAALSAALLGGWVLSASSDIRSDEVIIIDGCAPPQVMIGGTCSDLSPGGSSGQHGGDPLAPGGPGGGGGGGGGSPPADDENDEDDEYDEYDEPEIPAACLQLEDALIEVSLTAHARCEATISADANQLAHWMCAWGLPGHSYSRCLTRVFNRASSDAQTRCDLDWNAAGAKAADMLIDCVETLK